MVLIFFFSTKSTEAASVSRSFGPRRFVSSKSFTLFKFSTNLASISCTHTHTHTHPCTQPHTFPSNLKGTCHEMAILFGLQLILRSTSHIISMITLKHLTCRKIISKPNKTLFPVYFYPLCNECLCYTFEV